MMRPPGGCGEHTQREGRKNRQGAVEERRRDRIRIRSAERDEGARQPELDESEAPRGERQRAQDADERPGGERLDPRDVPRVDPHGTKAHEEDDEDGQMADERSDREDVPAPSQQIESAGPESRERVSTPVDLAPAAHDEVGLGLGAGDVAEEFGRGRQDPVGNDIDVGGLVHGEQTGECSTTRGGVEGEFRSGNGTTTESGAIRPAKKKAGRLPLSGPPLLS